MASAHKREGGRSKRADRWCDSGAGSTGADFICCSAADAAIAGATLAATLSAAMIVSVKPIHFVIDDPPKSCAVRKPITEHTQMKNRFAARASLFSIGK
jgi:hypothetical protein